MRKNIILLALLALYPTAPAAGQTPMTCQLGSGDSATCVVYHYHLRKYQPERKASVELTGVNEFASSEACEAALLRAQTENRAIVRFLGENKPRAKFRPDTFGPCHCDMTRNPASPNNIDAKRRISELRMQQNIAADVRELLLDADATPSSQIVRSLGLDPSKFEAALWPKALITPDPEEMVVDPQPVPESESKETTIASSPPRGDFGSGLDLELVDIVLPDEVMVAAAVAPAYQPSEDEYGEATLEPVTAGSNPADTFVSFESSRVQAILQASNAIDDAGEKKKIFEAAMHRLQVLSNLKVVVLASGTDSDLADAFAALDTEDQRVSLMSDIFGSTVASHWIPQDAREVVIEIPTELTADPVSILRESTGRYDDEQRKQALFHLLGRTANLTSSQELWVAELMISFL